MPLQRSAQRSVGGRGQDQEARQPRQYRGVRRRSWGRYVSEIRLPGKNTRVWLGSYSTPESAARAHDAAAFFLHGDPAALNFPESASSLPRPNSSSPADIREAASRAADPARGGGVGGRVEPAAAVPEPEAGAAEEQGSGGSWGEWWEAVEDAKEAPLHSPVRMDGAWDGRGFSEFWMEESLLLM